MRAPALLSSLLALALLAAPTASPADESRLSGGEITAALAGNTAHGVQKGTPWKQYFDPDGSTVYVSGDDAPSPGRWRVRGDDFCSLWPPRTEWDCYTVTGAGDRVTWHYHGGGEPWPARVVDGNRLED